MTTKRNFSRSKKYAFPKGLAHAFGQKMSFSSLLRFGQNKILKKLNYFKEKKETFFEYNKKNLAFGQKMPFLSLFRFDQNETRNNTF